MRIKNSFIGECKYCELCGKRFYYKIGEGKRDWNRRQFCSRECRNKGWKPSEKTKRKISEAFSLEKHPQWKEGGFHKGKALLKIIKRYGIDISKCQNCNKPFKENQKKDVHHKDKNPLNNKINNLMVVCRRCHKRLDGYGFYTDLAKKEGKAIATVWANFDYKRNPEKYKEKNRRRYLKNKEKILAHDRIYYRKNKEKILKRDKEYQQRPEIKERRRKYNQKPEVKAKRKEYMKKYWQKQKEEFRIKRGLGLNKKGE